MGLSKEIIIHEAILLLNEKGITYLTMRELATKLNIKAASLYWHIKNKEELLQLISESICEKICFDDESNGNSRDHIVNVCNSYRSNLLDVRDSVEVFNSTVPLTPARLRLITSILNTIQSIGVKDEYLIQVAHLINNFVLSFVADEIRMQQAAKNGLDSFMGYPMNFNFNKQFNENLDVILNGIIHSPNLVEK